MSTVEDASEAKGRREGASRKSEILPTSLNTTFIVPNLRARRDDKDYCSRFIFPVSFAIIQVVYWITYTIVATHRKEAIAQTAETNFTFYSK